MAAIRRQMLLDVLDEFVAMASDDELCLGEMVALEDRLSDAAAMVVVNGIDRVVEDDQRGFDAPAFGK